MYAIPEKLSEMEESNRVGGVTWDLVHDRLRQLDRGGHHWKGARMQRTESLQTHIAGIQHPSQRGVTIAGEDQFGGYPAGQRGDAIKAQRKRLVLGGENDAEAGGGDACMVGTEAEGFGLDQSGGEDKARTEREQQ